jgi:hypothetical protein
MTELFTTVGAFSKEFVAALAENEARAKAAEAVAKGGAFDGRRGSGGGGGGGRKRGKGRRSAAAGGGAGVMMMGGFDSLLKEINSSDAFNVRRRGALGVAKSEGGPGAEAAEESASDDDLLQFESDSD